MDAIKLNLSDALKLASVVSKYVDEIRPQADPIEFISGIVNKISPEEYLACVSLMTKTDIDTIKQEIPLNVLSAFIEGLKLNQIVTLLSFTKSLGL